MKKKKKEFHYKAYSFNLMIDIKQKDVQDRNIKHEPNADKKINSYN